MELIGQFLQFMSYLSVGIFLLWFLGSFLYATVVITYWILMNKQHDEGKPVGGSDSKGEDPQEPPGPTSTATKVNVEVNHGEFIVEFDDGGDELRINTTAADGGNDAKSVRHEVGWKDGTRHLAVEKGVLTVDGKNRGEIKRGARIHINSAGEVSIHDPKT